MNKSSSKLALNLFTMALIIAGTGAQASLVTGSTDPAYTMAFQGASAKTFADAGYNVGQSATDLKVYTNTWVDPAGLTFGTLMNPSGTAGNPGQVTNKLVYSDQAAGSIATNANARDYFFNVTFGGSNSPNPANDTPWLGNIFNLGGQANKAVIFGILDHGPHPQESLEYTIYLSNNPTSTNLSDWKLAVLDAIYLEGWEVDTVSKADAFTSVWKLPGSATFQYVSVEAMGSQALGYGTPGGFAPGGDAEIDAVAGLTEKNLPVPEPGSLPLCAAAIALLAASRRCRIR